APNGSGVAVANGVVYFQSLDGTLYALDAKAPDAEHALLATFQTGGNFSGPAVANGHVYLGTGSVIPTAPYAQYHNGITALGLPPRAAEDLHGDLAALGAALTSADQLAAAGSPNDGQLDKAVNDVNHALGGVVSDLAPIVGVNAPSTKALRKDFTAYYLAVAAGDAAGARAALADVKAGLHAAATPPS